jgi:hypothetical protein
VRLSPGVLIFRRVSHPPHGGGVLFPIPGRGVGFVKAVGALTAGRAVRSVKFQSADHAGNSLHCAQAQFP